MAKRVEQFRIFLSSPGDVQAERDIARELINDVLPYSPFIRGRATFDVVSWDDPHAAPGLDAHLTPQEAINRQLAKPSDCDIVIVILWSRMGTPMPSTYTKEDGSTYQSGTEWEYEDAAGGSGRTLTLLYRRTEEPTLGARDPEVQEKLEQVREVDDFFERFQRADGSLSGSFATYETVGDFRGLLRQNLESVVSRLLGDVFSEELGVTKAAVDSMMAILKEQEVPPEQLEAKLKEIAERHLDLTEKLHQLSTSNDEPEVAKRREQAAEAIEQGKYDRADALLADAVAIDRSAIDEQQETLDRRKLSAAATIAQQGELERTRLNYRKAAEHFAEAADLVEGGDNEAYHKLLMAQALVLDSQGREFGDNSALTDAIRICRSIISERGRKSKPDDLASYQFLLGNSLQALGEREMGTGNFLAAGNAYRAAANGWSRKYKPLNWSAAQGGLGDALRARGARESGTESLEAAVDAYKAALEERTRERAPIQWATTQNNLAAALYLLGEREDSVERLCAAADALMLALEERTRERVPLDWAQTQNNLGDVLRALASHVDSNEILQASINAFEAALQEWTRERVPLDWALAKNNLGLALKHLGDRTSNSEFLNASIAAYRAALKELTRQRAPIYWATAQNNLGTALFALGKRKGNVETLQAAVEAHNAALEERTRERVPLQWATTQAQLGDVLFCLGNRTGRNDQLEAALAAIKNASEVYLDKAGQTQFEAYFRKQIAGIEAAIARLS